MRKATRRNVLKTAGVCAAALAVFGMDTRALQANPSLHAPQGDALPAWAAQRFLTHWNCTQAIMEAFVHAYGCDMATAQKISTAFAGGMCQGAFCGSFTGGFMVIGLAHGNVGAPDKDVAGRVMTLSSAMRTQFGSLFCWFFPAGCGHGHARRRAACRETRSLQELLPQAGRGNGS